MARGCVAVPDVMILTPLRLVAVGGVLLLPQEV